MLQRASADKTEIEGVEDMLTNKSCGGSGVHDGRLESMEARDKVHSAIILQTGHCVTGGGDVLIQTNTPGQTSSSVRHRSKDRKYSRMEYTAAFRTTMD